MKKLLWLILGLVILIGLVLVYFYLWPKMKPNEPVVTKPSPTISASTIVKDKISDKGVTWIAPKKLDDLGLVLTYKNDPKSESTFYEVTGYYKTADLIGGGELILVEAAFEGPGGSALLRFRKDDEGKYYYLVKLSDEKEAIRYEKFLAKSVMIDASTSYMSLAYPDFVNYKNTTLKSTASNGIFTNYKETPALLGETEYGKIYQAKVSLADAETGGANFLLLLADNTYTTYTFKFPFMTDDEVARITWNNGTQNKDKFTSEGYISCGTVATDNVILNNANISNRLKAAGKTDDNETVYTVSASDPVAQKAYENYKIGREAKDIITIDEFLSRNVIFVWQSPMGIYVIFTNRNYGGLAECGKPVIYLYPQKPANVLVKVKAEISKSEPKYNDGWKVLANPSGKLIVDGQSYDSLFWEGQGLAYPTINRGVVVKTSEAVDTIKTQLNEMGFTTKEIADFVEFWAPKMPNKPFTRLTWFGTEEMNALAPLDINPAPDTLIRVFLDFEGLNQPINITPQTLTPFARRGFTVVEWGGLLK